MDDGTETVVDESKQVVAKPVVATPVVATPASNSWFPDTSSLTGALDSAKEGTSSFFSGATDVTGFASTGTDYFKSLLPGSEEPEVSEVSVETNGGKRRSKQMRMKGGRGLGLDYYATSVNGIKVAQPTYMEYYKGGKRRTKRSRRRSKRRRTCKRRRSCKR